MISRTELYDLVWSEPMTKVAKRFDVSNSYMARVCATLNVPRPARGYWAKLAVGKAPPPDPLPEARPGDQFYWTKEGDMPPQPRLRQTPPSRSTKRVRIPRDETHILLRGAKAHFEKTRPVDDGGYLKPYKKLLIDVTASKECLDKALGLANDLFNAFESVGRRVVIAPPDEKLRRGNIDEREVRSSPRDPYYYRGPWHPHRPTVVYLGTMAIGLAVVEMSEKVLFRYVRGEYIRETDYIPPKPSRRHIDHTWTTPRVVPSGRLRVIAYSPYHRVDWYLDWEEKDNRPLQSSLKSIVESIEEMAIELVAKLEEAERQAEISHQKWLVAREEQRQEEDRERVEQSIQDSRKQLDQIIHQWSRVIDVEHFLSGVEQHAASLSDAAKESILERVKLARDFLGTQDPMDFFLTWKTPTERYQPRYPGSAEDALAANDELEEL